MSANEDLIDQLHAVMHAFRSEMKRVVQESGHSLNGMEVRALLWIARHPGGSARELAQHSGRDKAQLARVIQQLEQAALVSRAAHASDRRLQCLNLTAAGAALMESLQRERQHVSARMLGKLSAAEQKQLAALLARLV